MIKKLSPTEKAALVMTEFSAVDSNEVLAFDNGHFAVWMVIPLASPVSFKLTSLENAKQTMKKPSTFNNFQSALHKGFEVMGGPIYGRTK